MVTILKKTVFSNEQRALVDSQFSTFLTHLMQVGSLYRERGRGREGGREGGRESC